MLKEAEEFGVHVKKCQAAIQTLKSASDNMFVTTKQVMCVALPHIYEETAAVAGGDIKPLEPVGGSNFAGDTISRANLTSNQRIESEVLVPIKRWLDALGSLKSRGKELDRLRLELDAVRRKKQELASGIDKQRTKLSRTPSTKSETLLNEKVKKLQEIEAKETIAASNFQEHETALGRDLSSLIKDAGWLKHYVACSFTVESEAMAMAAAGFGNTNPSTPSMNSPTGAVVPPMQFTGNPHEP